MSVEDIGDSMNEKYLEMNSTVIENNSFIETVGEQFTDSESFEDLLVDKEMEEVQ